VASHPKIFGSNPARVQGLYELLTFVTRLSEINVKINFKKLAAAVS
jgi:hypothetical protein